MVLFNGCSAKLSYPCFYISIHIFILPLFRFVLKICISLEKTYTYIINLLAQLLHYIRLSSKMILEKKCLFCYNKQEVFLFSFIYVESLF